MKLPSSRPSPVVESGSARWYAAIVDAPIDVAGLVARVSHQGAGAVSVFLGTVRDVNDGRAVTGVEYSAYRPMALSELQAIAHEVCEGTAGLQVAVEHRLGSLALVDVSVAIAVSHARRAPALDATRLVIEALKVRVPIWKHEQYVSGERGWVDPTSARHADAVEFRQ